MNGDKARACVAFRKDRVALYAERAAQGQGIFDGEPIPQEELAREREEAERERQETRKATAERKRQAATQEANRKRPIASAAMMAITEAFIRHWQR